MQSVSGSVPGPVSGSGGAGAVVAAAGAGTVIGGATSSGTAGAGGSIAVGVAGAVGAAGAPLGQAGAASVACPGIPITPDAGGFVSPASNTLGIHGSWFQYSDCVDLKNVNCSTVTSPKAMTFPNTGGKMCTSGKTSMAANAWGAGIGLELNDGPPQMPYDTAAHGIKGFCFVLSGAAIPVSTIRVAFPTKTNPDNAYFKAVSAPGQQTVLFSDTAQGTWVTAKSAFDPKQVMLLQFQIPAQLTAPVSWDFCIEGLTAIMQ